MAINLSNLTQFCNKLATIDLFGVQPDVREVAKLEERSLTVAARCDAARYIAARELWSEGC